MKLAFFTPTLNVGGYEKVVLTFANYFSEFENYHVSIVCGDVSGQLRTQISEKVQLVDLQCRTKTLLFKLIDYFKNDSPDFFYSGFRVYNSISVLARQMAGNRHIKILVSQHGYEYQGSFERFFHGILQKKADGLIAVTHSLLEYEQKCLHLKCPACVVGNPVIKETDNYGSVSDKWFDDVPVLCVCGRLSYDKNIALSIEILKNLHRLAYVSKLVILGDGPERDTLESLVKNYGLNDYVRFEGFVNNPIKYMKKCTVYLHTCDREGFGNTVVEALFAGLPVVTTDCGGPVEIIENDKYGVCFGDGRATNAADNGVQAVIKVLQNKNFYSKLKSKALTYSVKNVSLQLIDFISSF